MTRLVLVFALAAGCAPKHVYPDGGGLVGQLNREVQALQQTVRALEVQVDTCRDENQPPDPLYQELHQILKATEVKVERRGRLTVVTFPADHLFGVDGLSLRSEAQMTLDIMSTAIKINPNYAIVVEGHTDDTGVPVDLRKRFGDPFTYSAARAYAVVDTMVKKFAVPPERFAIVGRGPNQPLDSNDTDAGRRSNRRIVMYLEQLVRAAPTPEAPP